MLMQNLSLISYTNNFFSHTTKFFLTQLKIFSKDSYHTTEIFLRFTAINLNFFPAFWFSSRGKPFTPSEQVWAQLCRI